MFQPVNHSYILFQFLLLILACYALSFQIMHGLAYVSRRYLVLRLILFPGVILHELAHAAACFLTGTPIERISFWDETGGSVVHHKPKLAPLTQPLISIAPFPVGIITLLTISHYLTAVPWGYTIIMIFLMVSIAGTLAPSKTDLIHAIEGSLVLSGIALALYLTIPTFLERAATSVQTFNTQLLLVDAILVGIWLFLILIHNVLPSRR